MDKKGLRRKTPEGVALPPRFQGGKDPGKSLLARINPPLIPPFHHPDHTPLTRLDERNIDYLY